MCDLRAFAETPAGEGRPSTACSRCCALAKHPSKSDRSSVATRPLWLPRSCDRDARTLGRCWSIGGERSEWPDREVRLWGSSSPAQSLSSGPTRSAPIGGRRRFTGGGRYLVEVGTKSRRWLSRDPSAGPDCRPVYVGSSSATRLREAVAAGDRRQRFSDHELDELVPLLADLLEAQRDELPDRDQRLALLERIADENWRLIDVVAELDDRFGDPRSSRPELIEPFLTDVLPMAWVNPVIDAVGDGLGDQIDHLWTVAPSLAACLDRSSPRNPRSFDECERRWRSHTGLKLSWDQPPHRRLDLLAAQIPQPSKGKARR